MRKSTFTFAINPLLYITGDERDSLRETFETQKVESTILLTAVRRRSFWAIRLPTGVFLNEFRPGLVEFSEDIRARDLLLARIREEYGYQPYRTDRAMVRIDDVTYYHHDFIKRVSKHIDPPAFFHALDNFLMLAQAQPELIKGVVAKAMDVLSPEERYKRLGYRARGPGWTEHEDMVLRQWFGRRTVGEHAGRHVKLSDDEWTRVLAQLKFPRSRASVRQRIVVLNKALAKELMVDGYVPASQLLVYMNRVLGERPHRPHMAPTRRKRGPNKVRVQQDAGN